MSLQLLELSVRVLGTAAIVYAVSRTVASLGPHLGGLVAGLPVVVGPGLFFLALDLSAEQLATAAAATVLVLPATLVFMFAYAVSAAVLPPLLAAALALAGWLVAALLLSLLPANAPAAFAFFVGTALLFRGLLAGRPQGAVAPTAPQREGVLAVRAILAGILVGAVTLAADVAGPRLAGMLLSVPVAMIVIAVSVHRDRGAPALVGTLRSAFLGTVSIAAFGFTVALAAPAAGGLGALAAALLASLGLMAALVTWQARIGGGLRRGARGPRSRR